MSVADLVMKWIHVSSAAVLVGAVALLLWVLLPALLHGGDLTTGENAIVSGSKKVVHSSLGLLLLTGVYNFWRVLGNAALAHNMVYQEILGAKILLFIIVFGMAVMLFRKAFTGASRALLSWMVALLLLILFLSAYLNQDRIHILTQAAGARIQ